MFLSYGSRKSTLSTASKVIELQILGGTEDVRILLHLEWCPVDQPGSLRSQKEVGRKATTAVFTEVILGAQ